MGDRPWDDDDEQVERERFMRVVWVQAWPPLTLFFLCLGRGKSRTILRNHALLTGPPRWVLKTYRLRRSDRWAIVWTVSTKRKNDFHFA
jgi:hypothetical protein